MVKSIIVLVLTAVLILSLVLQATFSYNTFIPWDFRFGFSLYCVLGIFILLIGESVFKARGTFIFPIFLIIINTIVYFTILHYFEPGSHAGHGAGGLMYLLLFIGVTVGLIVYGGLRQEMKALIINKWEIFDKAINKYFIVTSSVLILLIASINAFSFYDYSTKGIHYKLSEKSNFYIILDTAKELNDISQCELLNLENSYTIIGCFKEFFKQTSDIQAFNEANSISKKETFNFHEIYNSLKNEQCIKTTYKQKCKDALLIATNRILLTNLGKHFHDISNSRDTLGQTNVSRYWTIISRLKDQDRLIRQLQGIPSIVSMEKTTIPPKEYKPYLRYQTRSPRYETRIKLDVRKLINHQKDITGIISRIDSIRRKKLNE